MNYNERFRPLQRRGYLAIGLALAIFLLGALAGVNGNLIIAFEILLVVAWIWYAVHWARKNRPSVVNTEKSEEG